MTLLKRGTYLARYTVFVPERASIDTVLSLRTDDQALLSSVIRAHKHDSCQSVTYCGQALVAVEAGARLGVHASGLVNINDAAATAAVSLSIAHIL